MLGSHLLLFMGEGSHRQNLFPYPFVANNKSTVIYVITEM